MSAYDQQFLLPWSDGRCVQDPKDIHRSVLIYDY